ncbi:hypothetical protein H4R19_002944 [Coemansia spiralis]|nr:hypothetical protein H4R19_002944 [Coemansia spiralis]
MSSVTSLRVDKGGRKFAPKAKPRPTRQPASPEKRRRNSRAAERTHDSSPDDVDEDDAIDEAPAVRPRAPAGSTGAVVIGLPQGIEERERAQQQQQQQQSPAMRSSGTPIVVGASPRGPAMRRPSAAAPARLASLGSSIGLGSPRAAPQPALSTQRERVQPMHLTGAAKRARTASSTPEPAPLRMKTVDDYELLSAEEISGLTIEYFCRDNRHGRPTKEFIERENTALRRLNMPPGSRGGSRTPSKPTSPVVETVPQSAVSAVSAVSAASQEEDAGARMAAQVRVINGKVVIDTDSLVVSRSDMAKDSGEPLELVDESERPRFINSLTYVKKRGSRRRWRLDETELFYQQLRRFGSDFEMIASVMPNRCRYDIRNKFKLEERKNPQRITDTLLRRRPEDVGTPPPPPPPADDAPPELVEYTMAVGEQDPESDSHTPP